MIELIGMIGAAVLAAVGAYFAGRQSGKQRQRNEQMRDTAQRQQAGREAVRNGRASGDSPDQRLRDNDGHW